MIRRTQKAISAAFVAALLITGCAKLPIFATNQIGPEVLTQEHKDSLYYSPTGPVSNSNQLQILNGFLYAGNGPQDDYAVARQYLTVKFSSKWQPAQETLILNGQFKVLQNSGTKIRIRVNYDAEVNADGIYRDTKGSSRVLEYHLIEANGEWRISSAPNLTALNQANFGVLFKSVPIYFWDHSFSYMIPDLRWFPTKASLPTKLTNALIKGAAPWLSPAVQNLLPAGTKLNINSVTVSSGTATIDFNANALKIPNWKRPYLKSQLMATLGAVDGVSQISISIARNVQTTGTGPNGNPEMHSGLPILLNSNGLSQLAGSSMFAMGGTDALVRSSYARDFALSADEGKLAILGNGKISLFSLVILAGKEQVIDRRTLLLPPTFDAFDALWTASRAKGATIKVTDTSGSIVYLPNPYGKSVAIDQIAISQEGSRLLVRHSFYNGSSVDVFPIVRDKDHKVVGLAPALQLPQFGHSVQYVGWKDRNVVSALVTDSLGTQSVWQLELGGLVTIGKPTVQAVAALTSTSGSQYYLDRYGDVYVANGLGWDKVQAGISSIRMAGQ